MKKLFLSLVAAMVAATAAFAQSATVATLNHEGTVSVFYGASGLSQALSAANHGDEIVLSAGRFNGTNITKAVTIRGAGFEEDTLRMSYPTIIVNGFNIQIPDSVTQRLMFEGLYCDSTVTIFNRLSNATFLKCRFITVRNSNSNKETSNIYNMTFANCRVRELNFRNTTTSSTVANQVNCINSYIGNPNNYNSIYHWMEFTNCIVYEGKYLSNSPSTHLYNSVFHNCILYGSTAANYSFILDSSNLAYHCVGYSGSSKYGIFDKINKTSNIEDTDLAKGANAKIFKSGTYYELTDEAKAKYVGGDGTEVGIYGGNLPWSSEVLAPRITKCEVANKTTSDGKLSVNIEVKAAE